MTLAERVASHTTRVVLLSAVLVALGLIGADTLGGGWQLRLVGLAIAAGVALGLAHLSARDAALPGLKRLHAVAKQTESIAQRDALDERLVEIGEPEVSRVSRAVNELLERVRTERETLAAESSRSRSMADASPNGVLVVGTSGEINYLNAAFVSTFGLEGEAMGRRPLEVVDVVAVQRLIDAVVESGESAEVPAQAGDRELALLGVPLSGGAMVICQDVTRFRRAEQARTDFVTNVSHELRTPIATIMGYAETLQGDDLPPGSDRLVAAIVRNGRRLSDLFEDLLELSRIEARRRELPVARRKLQSLVQEAVAMAAEQAANKGQAFSLTCPPDVVARVNPEALVAVISNLALNACNYTPEGGHIEVVVSQEEDAAVVRVSDDGIGIERAQQARIFERFYRVDSGRSRNVGGTGLGLAIVKHLCKASGAEVSLESVPGEGSTFTVRFPTA
ncbi:MAG: PAS domain-containing protein [Proteobacteria bacterium]|nr:PAS domain-containing protein [Pseudomonadota bacterium]